MILNKQTHFNSIPRFLALETLHIIE